MGQGIDELLKRIEQMEDEIQFLNSKIETLQDENRQWSEGYGSLLKENITLKCDIGDLKNSYVDDLTDAIETLIAIEKKMVGDSYKMKHAKEN